MNITSPVTVSFKLAVNVTGVSTTIIRGSVVVLTLIVKLFLTTLKTFELLEGLYLVSPDKLAIIV